MVQPFNEPRRGDPNRISIAEDVDETLERGEPIAEPTDAAEERAGTCTQSQLRRFIKSRPYVPLHELRRRFAINGPEDDVVGIRTSNGQVFVGLPAREGQMIGELVRQGEIGYELLLDPASPVVVGVYPIRPIPRS